MEEPEAQRPNRNETFDINAPNFQKELVDKMDKLSLARWTTASTRQTPMRQQYSARLCMTPPDALRPFVRQPSYAVNTRLGHSRLPDDIQGGFEYQNCAYQMHPNYDAAIDNADLWDQDTILAYREAYTQLYAIVVIPDNVPDWLFFNRMSQRIRILTTRFSVCIELPSPPNVQHLTDLARAVKWAMGDIAYSMMITGSMLSLCRNAGAEQFIVGASNWIILEQAGLLQLYKRPVQHIRLRPNPVLTAVVNAHWPDHPDPDWAAEVLRAVFRASGRKFELNRFNETPLDIAIAVEHWHNQHAEEDDQAMAGPADVVFLIRQELERLSAQQQADDQE